MRERTRRVATVATVSLLTLAVLSLLAVPASAVLGADLTISSSASPDPVAVGEQLTYTITVQNEGTEDSTSVTVTDVLASNRSPGRPVGTSCAGPPRRTSSAGSVATTSSSG